MPKRLAIILAAGQGKRMGVDLPKVVVPVLGRPMIDYVVDAVEAAGFDRVVVVVGYKQEKVRAALANRRQLSFVEQPEPQGTGHAVRMAREEIAGHEGVTLILAGDSPMVQVASLQKLLAEFERTRPACLLGTLKKDNPAGLGRIVRDSAGEFRAIVEERDATVEQRALTEVNMSTYLFESRELLTALDRLKNENQQGEYYLTDCPGILLSQGRPVKALCVLDPIEALSINTPDELAAVEAALRQRQGAKA